MKIYISLPISGRDMEGAKRTADLWKAAISRAGHQAVNPFEVYAGRNPTYYDHICSDLRALFTCDAVLMCPGWGRSKGCSLEFEAAKIYGLKLILDGTIPKNEIK